jgi:aminoglycoside 2''-phosphotransferase
VDPGWIFRFPRTAPVARALEREIRLLPDLERLLPCAVPRLEWRARHRGRPFVGYRRIEGRALAPDDLTDATAGALAGALAALHRFPVERARALLGEPGTLAAWAGEYEELRERIAARAGALLAPELRAALARGFDAFLARDLPSLAAPALVHRDLGPEHVLVDAAQGSLRGLIDWGDAALGDPAIDFAGLWIAAGEARTRPLLRRYPMPRDEAFERRIRFYAAVAPLHDIEYGIACDRPELVAGGVRELPERLRDAGLLA